MCIHNYAPLTRVRVFMDSFKYNVVMLHLVIEVFMMFLLVVIDGNQLH